MININQAKVQQCQNKNSKIIFRHYDWSTILFYCFECYTFYNIPVANVSSASPAPSKRFVLVLTSALLYLVIRCRVKIIFILLRGIVIVIDKIFFWFSIIIFKNYTLLVWGTRLQKTIWNMAKEATCYQKHRSSARRERFWHSID